MCKLFPTGKASKSVRTKQRCRSCCSKRCNQWTHICIGVWSNELKGLWLNRCSSITFFEKGRSWKPIGVSQKRSLYWDEILESATCRAGSMAAFGQLEWCHEVFPGNWDQVGMCLPWQLQAPRGGHLALSTFDFLDLRFLENHPPS